MKIDILGFYNQNAGDSQYKVSFPILFPHHKFNFVNDIKPNKERDCVILGGGDVLNDYFYKELQKADCKKYAMSVDRSPLSPKFEEICESIIYRNEDCPDFAFALKANKENGKKRLKSLAQGINLYENVIAIVVNAYLQKQGTDQLAREYLNFQKVAFDLAQVIDATNASFIFIPFCTSFPANDCLTNSVVYSKAKFWDKNLMIFEPLPFYDILDIISVCQACVTTRLHAAIFSCIGGTPFVDLTHHDKNRRFIEYIDKPWSLDYWHFDSSKLKFWLDEFILNQEKYRAEVSKIKEKIEFTNVKNAI